MYKNPYPYYGNIIKSAENQIAVLKIKTDLEQVSILAKQNMNKFCNLNEIKKNALKEMMYSNSNIPDTWINKSDYHKIGKQILKDKKLLKYMKETYPTEAIIEFNTDKRVTSNQVLKNHINKIVPDVHPVNPNILKTEDTYESTIKELKKLNPELNYDLNLIKTKKDLANANIVKNVKSSILKNKFEKDNDKELIKKVIKNDENIENIYEKNEKYFKEKLIRVNKDDSINSDNDENEKDKFNAKYNKDVANTLKIKKMYSFLSKDLSKKTNKNIIKKTNFDINFEAQNFVLKERKRNDNNELISEDTKKHLELVQLGNEEKIRNNIEFENKKNSSNYLKILSQIKKNISNQELTIKNPNSGLLSFIINDPNSKVNLSPKKNKTKTNELKDSNNFNQEHNSNNNSKIMKASPLKIKDKNQNSEFMVTQSSLKIKIMKKKTVKLSSATYDESNKPVKYIIKDKTKNNVIVDQTDKVKHDLKPVSIYNKIKKIENYYPAIVNKKLKNLIIEIKDHSSYGPYISICECCNKKNVDFYNKSNPNDAINILNHILNQNNKKLNL